MEKWAPYRLCKIYDICSLWVEKDVGSRHCDNVGWKNRMYESKKVKKDFLKKSELRLLLVLVLVPTAGSLG